MFVLHERLAILAGDYSGKKKIEKGGQALNLLTFELEGIPLDEQEVNAFFGHPHAYQRLHCYVKTGDNYETDLKLEPFLPGLKSLELRKPLEGACVALRYGISDDRLLNFTDCKLSKITISLGDNGETALSCKVTSAPALDETLAELFEQFGKPIKVEIRSYPPEAQKEMPLNQHGEGEQPEAPSPQERRGKGKRGKSRLN